MTDVAKARDALRSWLSGGLDADEVTTRIEDFANALIDAKLAPLLADGEGTISTVAEAEKRRTDHPAAQAVNSTLDTGPAREAPETWRDKTGSRDASSPASVPADVARGMSQAEHDLGWWLGQVQRWLLWNEELPRTQPDGKNLAAVLGAARAALRADVARGMMRALEPFASRAENYGGRSDKKTVDIYPTVGDIRAARAALQAARAAGIKTKGE